MNIPLLPVEQVRSFRLHRHNLDQRLVEGNIIEAAGVCAIPNTPPGAAEISLYARVEGLSQGVVISALERDKTLMQTWSLRGAPHIFPTPETALFTKGLQPQDNEEILGFIIGIEAALNASGLKADEVLQLTLAAIYTVLDGRVICSKRQLDRELAAEVGKHLAEMKKVAWTSPSIYGPNQSLGEAMVSFSLRPAALSGAICFTAREKNETCFGRSDQWLSSQSQKEQVRNSPYELISRYLKVYAPTKKNEFAAWAGIGSEQATRMWGLIEDELIEVSLEGRQGWVHQADLSLFEEIESPQGVRLLPAHDPYLQTRDHQTLIDDKWLQREIWKAIGSPGVLLADGAILGTWQSRKKGDILNLDIHYYSPLPSRLNDALDKEASGLAALRGCGNFTIKE